MKSNPVTVFKLFDAECHFSVPLFQRQYCWTQEKQWEYLWRDIEDQADRFLRAGGDDSPSNSGNAHFLGAIVTQEQSDRSTADVDIRDIIDGQQRLTTLQLVLAAYRDFVLSISNADEHLPTQKRLARMLTNTAIQRLHPHWYKVGPTSADRDHFQSIMSKDIISQDEADTPPNHNRAPDSQLQNAYGYFREQIEHYCIEHRTNGMTMVKSDRIQAIMRAFKDGLLLVHIELNVDDDPQGVFESLNDRGQPLLASDLIRNHVFNSPELKAQDLASVYEKYWRDFDHKEAQQPVKGESHFWKQDVRQGREFKPRLDLYMFYFVQSKVIHEVRVGGIFKEFQNWWRDSARCSQEHELLDEIQSQGELFAALSTPAEHVHHTMFRRNSYYWAFAERMCDIDVGTLYPLLLELFNPRRVNVVQSDLPTILQYLESYLVRRMVCGETSSNYNQYFRSLLNAVQRDESVTQDKVHRYLHRPEHEVSDSTYWPSDEQFHKAWCEVPLFTKLRSRRIAMILRALNDAMVGDAADYPRDKKVTVEHVLPRGWIRTEAADGWLPPMSHPLSDSDKLFVDARNRALNTIGNLTLMEFKWNARASNRAFGAKLSEYRRSQILLNRYFDNLSEWSETPIEQRSETLFNIALGVWPHPTLPLIK